MALTKVQSKMLSSAGGGGGSAIAWFADGANAPAEVSEFNEPVLQFESGLGQSAYAVVAVPESYVAGSPIKVRLKGYHQSSSATQLILGQASLIPVGTAQDSTTNQRTTTNTAQTGGNKVNVEHVLDITDSAGKINGVAVAPSDTIKVRIYRGTDTALDYLSVRKLATEVTFQ